MKRKQGSSIKRNPYVSMDGLYGMKDELLDAALLSHFSDSEIYTVIYNNATPTLLRTINVSKLELKKTEGSLLREKISGILNNNYDLYNKFVNRYTNFLESTLNVLANKTNRTHDEVVQSIDEFYKKDVIPTHTTINILRHYKNGLHKQLLVPLLAEQNPESLYEELISKQAPNINSQGNNLDEENENKSQEVEEDLIGDFAQNKESDIKDAPSEIIQNVIRMLERASEIVQETEGDGKYRDLYEDLMDEHTTLEETVYTQSNKIKELEKIIKLNTKQINGFSAEINQLKTTNTKLSQNNDNQLKEQGKIAQALGETRRERDELLAEKEALSRKLINYEKETKKIIDEKLSIAREELNKELKKSQINLDEAKQEVEILKNKMEIQNNNLVELQSELEESINELEKIGKDYHLLLSEREELREKQKQAEEVGQNEEESNLDFEWLAREFNYDNIPT
ncbi:hypothetical protein [Paenibacillus odorifer]|uniref:hypothetical protein n=1 Tax=Paenibacillus odorifer TaxID=189426 RepID=UPI00096C6680|nr:hypothetical protein [Paenibacillus odorifer]OME19920.1 hypothetical protein BSK57_23415 [Paenibacillus odorifer]